VHFRLGEYPEALAAIDRSLPKAYGQRKGYVLSIKANILEKQGQRDAARAIVEEQLALYRGLPEGQKQPQLEAAAVKRLASLSEKSPG
jgi:tetratricopeptide (TPR) repeat protein